jgi:hypothetical protein
MQDKLVSDKKFTNKILDVIAALTVLIDCVNSVPSRERLFIADMALPIASQAVRMNTLVPIPKPQS